MADEPVWDPHTTYHSNLESLLIGPDGRLKDEPVKEPNTLLPVIVTPEEHCLACVNTVLDTRAFAEELQASVGVLMTATTPSKTKLTADDLSKWWGISLEAAANTIQRTTQRGIRTVANPAISRRFRTNDWQLRYRRLPSTALDCKERPLR